MKRRRRIKTEDGTGCYHIVSRIVDRTFRMDDGEKELFRKMMRKAEGFCGVRIVTYCVLSNHFHILVDVPGQPELDEPELLRRIGILYGGGAATAARQRWERWRELRLDSLVGEEQGNLRKRMGDVSAFAATVKQRYTVSYNRRTGRAGTLWEARFKSVLVEGSDAARSTVAAYIDLNPVRAGIVKDPKDYRWSGYGEAAGGSKAARAGLESVFRDGAAGEWGELQARYRELLYLSGAEKRDAAGNLVKPGLSGRAIGETLARKGALTKAEALRCRVRYFTDGMALGSREFIEGVFRSHRSSFSKERKDGARPMRSADWGGLQTCRALRKDTVTIPQTVKS